MIKDTRTMYCPHCKERSNEDLINQHIQFVSGRGWKVVSRTDSSVQLVKPKQWNSTLLIMGLVLLIIFGVGLIFLLLAMLDYASQKEQVAFVEAQDLRVILGSLTVCPRCKQAVTPLAPSPTLIRVAEANKARETKMIKVAAVIFSAVVILAVVSTLIW